MTISKKDANYKKASDVFNIKNKELEFLIPVFKKKSKLVPAIDPAYQFKAETLIPVLWALVNNKKAWLSGHTGTGKSTLIAQVCAHLNWPLIRVNFDSEISRMDLVGRDTLKKDKDGVTISEFVDGILPQALQKRCVLLCDEVDFIRPDVAYVFQRALEDEGLLISEDGGRLVEPHPDFRIVATANTQGQGDDFGIYQGARAQSMAFLDRFTVWINCDYLEEKQERALVSDLVPDVSTDLLDQIMNYTREHREAFGSLKVSQPLSPRGIIALAEGAVFREEHNDNPVLASATTCLLNKANKSDKNVLVGILDRVAKKKVDKKAEAAKKAKEDKVKKAAQKKAKDAAMDKIAEARKAHEIELEAMLAEAQKSSCALIQKRGIHYVLLWKKRQRLWRWRLRWRLQWRWQQLELE